MFSSRATSPLAFPYPIRLALSRTNCVRLQESNTLGRGFERWLLEDLEDGRLGLYEETKRLDISANLLPAKYRCTVVPDKLVDRKEKGEWKGSEMALRAPVKVGALSIGFAQRLRKHTGKPSRRKSSNLMADLLMTKGH